MLLVRDRMRWLVHAMTISPVAILIAVNLIGAQRHVADANVARDQGWVMTDLEHRWRELNRPEATTWPSWNLARERARAALATLFGS